MYRKTNSAVKLGDAITDFLIIELGIIQGSVLGPILFNLLINDLIANTKEAVTGAKVGELRIPSFLFADDIAK